MKRYKNHTLKEYLKVLSAKEPVPGGGSAAALAGACAAALLIMVARYSIKRGQPQSVDRRIKTTIDRAQKIRQRLLELVDEDAIVYQKVVNTKYASPQKKRQAVRNAQKVPKEVRRLCYKAISLTPTIIKHGNKHLLADVEVAVELLRASFHSCAPLIQG